VHKGAKRMG